RVAVLEFRAAVAVAGFDVADKHRVIGEAAHRHERLFAVARDDDAWIDMNAFRHLLHLPTFGYVAEGGGDAREFFVAGEAEADKPLAVEGTSHRLKNPDAPLTVLHQLVVGRQDARNPPLDRQ